MIINFYLKEEANVGEESMTITITKSCAKSRSHISNTKKLDDFSAIEQQTIKNLITVIEKYNTDEHGANNLNYNL